MIRCRVCGKLFERITNSHLLHKHSMTTDEYWKQFPDAPSISRRSSEKMSKIASTYEHSIGGYNTKHNNYRNKDRCRIDRACKSRKETWANKTQEEIHNHVSKSQWDFKRYLVKDGRFRLTLKSQLEVRCFRVLASLGFDYQYESMAISYFVGSDSHWYIPDFVVEGRVVVEVKPDYLTSDSIVQAKKNGVLSKGYKFLFYTPCTSHDFVHRLCDTLGYTLHGGNPEPS